MIKKFNGWKKFEIYQLEGSEKFDGNFKYKILNIALTTKP